MTGKLLIANRGEIAIRIMRTARAMGIRTVAVYSDVDRKMFHVEQADEAVHIGGSPAAESYLRQDAIIAAALRTGADAIHPGYGFLSENPDFAEAVERAGLAFVGPPAAAMRALGLKHEAKRLMRKAGVPVVPGYEGDDQSPGALARAAEEVGFPLLVKPVAGGGGKGMRLVQGPEDLDAQLAAARREAASAFGDARVLLERHLPAARHVEVQVMADRHGNVLHLWERDCSVQRRHQKVIEEAPAPGLPDHLRHAMCEAAVTAARQVGYVGAGTVEFLLPPDEDIFFFIEMNTRLQVEHPVTEMITGLDLVALQLRAAAGERLDLAQHSVPRNGHAIELRLYAEDPAQDFKPQTGVITALQVAGGEGIRFDAGVRPGDQVSAFYDAMIGKLIVHAPSRQAALARLSDALARTHLAGLASNLGFLARLLALPAFVSAELDTRMIDRSIDLLARPGPPPPRVAAAAALAFEGWFADPRPAPAFHVLRGFRLWSDPRILRLDCDGAAMTVALAAEAGGFTLSHGGGTWSMALTRIEGPELWLEAEGRTSRLRCHADGEAFVIVADDGARFRFTREGPGGLTPAGRENRRVTAPVPGLLAKLPVSSGDMVEEGDVVAILEAMKTEFSLRAEARGKFMLFAKAGAQVKEGEVIAEIGEPQ